MASPRRDSTQTVNGNTVFAIGSATKTVTATLPADMVVHGEVRLELRLATGYDASRHAAPKVRVGDIEWIAPEGGLYSTANDLLKYAAANLGLTLTSLLDAMKLAQQARRDTDDNHWGMDFVGLGWEVLRKYDPELVWHNGAGLGYRSFVGLDWRHRRGVVVLWNSDNNLDDIGRHLLDPRYAVSRARSAIALDSKSFDQYVGEYRSSPTFGLTVTRQGTHSFMQGTGQRKSELFAESDTAFFEKGANTQVVFARDSAGGLTATVYSQGLDFTLPKVH